MPSDHRLHPTSILFALAGSLKTFLVPAIVLLLTTGRTSETPSAPDGWGPGQWGPGQWASRWMPGDFEIANWQFWLLLFLIPSTIVAVARYLSFRLHYEGTELVIRSGIFFRNERHVPYLRIQNLDAVRNVAHRLLGVAEVRVETGGGQAPEATISVLHETVFEEMRRRIFEGRARANQAHVAQPDEQEAPVPAVESRTLLHLPLRELFLNGLLDNRGMVLVATAYGALWQTGLSRVVWDRFAGAFVPDLVRDSMRGLTAGTFPSFARLGVLLIELIVVLLFVRVLSMVWSAVRLHEFRLTRVGDDLRTEYGLLTRVTATIPLRRVQTLTIREAPLQRLVKRMSVRVETAGGQAKQPEQGRGPKQPRESLAPIIRRAAVPALVREVLPGIELDTVEWLPLHPRAFRRAMKPAALIAIGVTAPLVGLFGWRGLAVLPFTLAWMGIVAWKQVQHTQWAVDDNVVVFRSGWLWKTLTVAPVMKIQTVGRAESPFDRRAAMASVRIDTAGGASPVYRISIPYLARETASTLYERLATQTANTSFRW